MASSTEDLALSLAQSDLVDPWELWLLYSVEVHDSENAFTRLGKILEAEEPLNNIFSWRLWRPRVRGL